MGRDPLRGWVWVVWTQCGFAQGVIVYASSTVHTLASSQGTSVDHSNHHCSCSLQYLMYSILAILFQIARIYVYIF